MNLGNFLHNVFNGASNAAHNLVNNVEHPMNLVHNAGDELNMLYQALTPVRVTQPNRIPSFPTNDSVYAPPSHTTLQWHFPTFQFPSGYHYVPPAPMPTIDQPDYWTGTPDSFTSPWRPDQPQPISTPVTRDHPAFRIPLGLPQSQTPNYPNYYRI